MGSIKGDIGGNEDEEEGWTVGMYVLMKVSQCCKRLGCRDICGNEGELEGWSVIMCTNEGEREEAGVHGHV